jgi:peptidyl-prolyl cis-trans isomerase SurA
MRRLLVAFVALVAAIGTGAVPAAQGTTGAGQGAAGVQGTASGAAAQGATPAALPVAARKSVIVQKIIVRVNGEIFTQTELEFRQIQMLRGEDRQVRRTEDLSTDPGLRTALAQVTPGILVDVVDELVLVQRAREMDMKYSDAQFTRSLDDMKKQFKLDDKTFPEALKQEGMTMADLRVSFEHQHLIRAVLQRELGRNMAVTEEEARQYYNTHRNEFMKPATMTLREILISVPGDKVSGQVTFSAPADESVKQKIAAVRERAVKGEDFAKLAAEVSDSATKVDGGLIGPLVTADVSPVLLEILDKMKPGDITEPLRTKTGYQLLKLEARTASEPEAFEKSKDAISQKIYESRADVEKAKYVQKLLAQAVIEWKDDGFKKMYETERAARLKNPPTAGK